MKNKIKLTLLMAVFALVFGVNSASAQIYDGITQPTRFRVWTPITISLEDGNTTIAPFFGYKQNVCDWFSVTEVMQYNINKGAFVPQVWLNFNVKQKFYILSRSIYDIKANQYRHTLSATYKLPKGFMIDATWENMFNGKKFCDTDRLQFVAGYGYKWFVANVGYSVRNKPGVVANVRFKLTDYNWIQLKYDQGGNNIQVGCAFQFN